MDWITCSACGLKHSPRPDGLCPRCRAATGATAPDSARFAPPSFDRPDFPRAASPGGTPPSGGEPLPTTAWGGGPPSAGRATAAGVTVGSLVTRSFSAWWANVGRFVGLTLIAYVPIAVAGGIAAVSATAQAAGGAGGPDAAAAAVLTMIPLFAVGGLATFVLAIAQFGGITFGTIQHLAGRRPTFGQMMGAGFRRLGPLFLAGLAATILIYLGLFLLIVPGILLALALSVVIPVIMGEAPQGVGAAFRRSFTLTKGSRGAIFGALVVLMLATVGASLVGNLVAAAGAAVPALAFVGALLSMVVQVAMTPLSIVLCAVAYHDLRLAKEGIDTSQLAQVFS